MYEVRKGGKRRKEANKPKNMKYAKVAHAVFYLSCPTASDAFVHNVKIYERCRSVITIKIFVGSIIYRS